MAGEKVKTHRKGKRGVRKHGRHGRKAASVRYNQRHADERKRSWNPSSKRFSGKK